MRGTRRWCWQLLPGAARTVSWGQGVWICGRRRGDGVLCPVGFIRFVRGCGRARCVQGRQFIGAFFCRLLFPLLGFLGIWRRNVRALGLLAACECEWQTKNNSRGDISKLPSLHGLRCCKLRSVPACLEPGVARGEARHRVTVLGAAVELCHCRPPARIHLHGKDPPPGGFSGWHRGPTDPSASALRGQD